MRIVAIFTDKEGMKAHRAQYLQDHLDFLKIHGDEILIGGSLRDERSGEQTGGMWVMEVDSYDRAHALIALDPYYATARRGYILNAWGKAFDEPVVL